MHVAADDTLPVEEDKRAAERLAEIRREVGEHGAVVGPGPRVGDHGRRTIRPPARSSRPLQVVGLSRRYVRHEYGRQAADVDAEFEGSGCAQDVSDARLEEVLEASVLSRGKFGAVLLCPQAHLEDR